ncbi:PAS domain S-box protein [bacterium]|nr:PAS domain S-box protein [bacterium]
MLRSKHIELKKPAIRIFIKRKSVAAESNPSLEHNVEHYLQQISDLRKELYLEKELVKKLKQTQEDWSELIEKVQPTIQALSEKIRELQSNLHSKNQELTNVLQSLSNGLIVTDLSGKIRTFNRAAVAITGFRNEDAINHNINDLFQFLVLPKGAIKKIAPLLEDGYQQQFTLKKGTSEKIILKSTTTLMRSDENELKGIIINLVDITQLKRLEEEAERKNRMTAMGEIAMQVAHELRNPLGSMELFISMMKMDFAPESEEMSLVMHINSAARSMNHIISNLLEYTKPRPIVLDEVYLHELINEFAEFSEFSAEQLGILIELELKAGKAIIQGNKDLIKQLFHNLFVNACQAMPEGGNLKIFTENYIEKDPVILKRLNKQFKKKQQSLIRVSFEDDGKGMTEDVRKKVFDPFFTTREQGTGLGLSIAYTTMTSHGGVIMVESAPDSGTKVDLLFPKAQ